MLLLGFAGLGSAGYRQTNTSAAALASSIEWLRRSRPDAPIRLGRQDRQGLGPPIEGRSVGPRPALSHKGPTTTISDNGSWSLHRAPRGVSADLSPGTGQLE
jgi:hypothetical protein